MLKKRNILKSLLTVCLQVEDQPVYEDNLYIYLYFVAFAISCFYTFNFFLRFIMASLQKAKICIYLLLIVYVNTLYQLSHIYELTEAT